eukprot:6490637-Amphidinium_carterae.3
MEISDRSSVWFGRESVPPTCLWSYDLSDITVVDPFLAADVESVDIFMSSTFCGQSLLVTYDDCCGFREVHQSLLRTLPPRKRMETRTHVSRKRQRKVEASSESGDSSESDAASIALADAETEQLVQEDTSQESASEEDEAEKGWTKAYEALEEDREAIRVLEVQADEWFRYDLMGGAWNITRSGKVAYGPRVSAKPNSVAAAFLKTFNVPNSASFEHATYGEQISHKLAALWKEEVTRKALFWHAQGSPTEWPKDKYKSAPLPPECEMDVTLLNARARTRREKILAIPMR